MPVAVTPAVESTNAERVWDVVCDGAKLVVTFLRVTKEHDGVQWDAIIDFETGEAVDGAGPNRAAAFSSLCAKYAAPERPLPAIDLAAISAALHRNGAF